jgi:hypothetical protein
MKFEVTICKHDLSTGKIDGMVYCVEGKRNKKGFNTVLDEAIQKSGVTLERNGCVNIEDEDGLEMGHTYYFKACENVEYRITLISNAELWNKVFYGRTRKQGSCKMVEANLD